MKNNKRFNYSYSAPTENETREIENIRNEYLPLTLRQKKYEELKKIDKRVKLLPFIVSMVLTILSILVLGFGLSLVLEYKNYIIGPILFCLGIFCLVMTYFIKFWLKKFMKKKYSNRILTLSEELLNEKDN